jgi:Uma2 family endonuclease
MASAEARQPGPVSLEQYARLPEDEFYKVEAVRGRLVHEPRPAPLHSSVQATLIALLKNYEWAHRTGGAVLVETEFVLAVAPLTVRIPDVAWVSRARIPTNGYTLPRWHFAPDLAVEVVSPRNTRAELDERVADFLLAGSRLVWVVDPRRRTVTVYEAGAEPLLLGILDELAAGDVLPRFRVPVVELFPD